jgi:hypothetical protein
MWDAISLQLKTLGEPASILLVLLGFVFLYARLGKIQRVLSNVEKQIGTRSNSN